jgi:CheY-like chemotaxis protein
MTKPKILIVEDESLVARGIHQQLLELGCEPVAETRRAEDAILLAGQLQPDLVLIDIHLAGEMDGIAAAQVIRERCSIPIVFLTALAGDSIMNQTNLAEPFGYIDCKRYRHRPTLVENFSYESTTIHHHHSVPRGYKLRRAGSGAGWQTGRHHRECGGPGGGVASGEGPGVQEEGWRGVG